MAKSLIKILTQDRNIGILSVTTGQLEIARIPVMNAPDWIIPKELILAIEPYRDRIWNFLWQGQDVSVYHLLPKTEQAESIIVLESITDVHRIGLQIQGDVTFHSVRISELKDVDATVYQQTLESFYPHILEQERLEKQHQQKQLENNQRLAYQPTEQDYVFQAVMLDGDVCIIPDLDKMSHFLVDLDS
ncbi:hypothetical protein MOMA_05085 [Moraxella macacae 0408225]|uniref:CheW-like domain-containing protein n=1 Tax=Moraxella macacae 0408225 TaxID=1230338 RepID=L2F9J8_9GAMM|nr:hypothetical protein [Moraxella macacae]ELA09749.1 hypothetical protein MOMA_05085 [Moraxella macacae 0408225]